MRERDGESERERERARERARERERNRERDETRGFMVRADNARLIQVCDRERESERPGLSYVYHICSRASF